MLMPAASECKEANHALAFCVRSTEEQQRVVNEERSSI